MLDRSLIHLLLQMRNMRLFDVTVSCGESIITLILCLTLDSAGPSTYSSLSSLTLKTFVSFAEAELHQWTQSL